MRETDDGIEVAAKLKHAAGVAVTWNGEIDDAKAKRQAPAEPMIRLSTQRRDALILKLYFYRKMEPKAIMVRLHLPNIWAVYDALKRDRRAVPRVEGPKT